MSERKYNYTLIQLMVLFIAISLLIGIISIKIKDYLGTGISAFITFFYIIFVLLFVLLIRNPLVLVFIFVAFIVGIFALILKDLSNNEQN